jgi:hypothetical protein
MLGESGKDLHKLSNSFPTKKIKPGIEISNARLYESLSTSSSVKGGY